MNIKPATRTEAFWAAVSDDSIAPPEPQTREECFLAAMSGNYEGNLPEPATRKQAFMKAAAEKVGEPVVQNVVFGDVGETMDTTEEGFLSYITELVIPEGVTNLTSTVYNGDGYDIFIGLTNLKKIMLPSSMTTVPMQVLGYSCGGTTPLNRTLKEIVVSEGTTKLANYAFEEMFAVESITLPQSLTEIGTGAFSCMKELKTINIPSGISSIPDNSFSDCPDITITINKPEGSIEGAPWGATNAEIIWNG